MVTPDFCAFEAYVWRFQNFVLGDRILSPCPEKSNTCKGLCHQCSGNFSTLGTAWMAMRINQGCPRRVEISIYDIAVRDVIPLNIGNQELRKSKNNQQVRVSTEDSFEIRKRQPMILKRLSTYELRMLIRYVLQMRRKNLGHIIIEMIEKLILNGDMASKYFSGTVCGDGYEQDWACCHSGFLE
ncbi:hypothetical protein VNO77_37848 [Canavalia gladiata]|uniref:Uncharacterized protein n=1 Tax=Canavalia gladiata TaxID=3824 RepID=A0AAN9PWV2_CANGL